MSAQEDTLFSLMQRMTKKAPELIELMTSESDFEFNAAFDKLLLKAAKSLESNSKNFQSLHEPGLAAAFALALSAPGLSAIQEANCNGHVDVIIEVSLCEPSRSILGEAKIYDGPQYHFQGLEQLMQYATGRESRLLMIEFVKKQNISALMKKVSKAMNSELPSKQVGVTKADAGSGKGWWFDSKHKHTSGELMQVSHIGCNLHCNVP